MLSNLYHPTGRLNQPLMRLWVYCGIVISVSLFITIAAACSQNIGLTGELPVDAPALANAGEKIAVTVGPVPGANNGTSVGLVMLGTYGPRVYRSHFEAGLAYFTIPAAHTLQPGYLALIVASGDARGEASVILFSERTTTIDYHEPASRRSEATSQISTEQP